MRPEVVYLVTHGGAQNARQMKVWRDLYELASYRTILPSTRVVRVYFGAKGLDGWDAVLDRAFDATVHVSLPSSLVSCMEKLADLSQDEVISETESRKWKPVVDDLSAAFERVRDSNPPRARFFLPGGGQSLAPAAPSMLRRGIALLGLARHSGARQFMKQAGIIAPSIVGDVWTEPYRWWVSDARAILGEDLGVMIARAADVLSDDAAHLAHMPEYLDAMHRCAEDPAVCKQNPYTVFLGIRYARKAFSLHSFSNARIARSLGKKAGTSELYALSRVFSGKRAFPEELLDSLPYMARQTVEAISTSGRKSRFQATLFRALLRDSAIKRRHLDPLGWLVQKALPGGVFKGRHPSVLDPTGRIATTRLYVVGSTALHWRTAHMGRRDKAKELAARGASLKPLVNRLILLLDGEWGESELRMLHEGGWNTVSVWQWRMLPDLLF